jgi:hypothetical protein
MSTGQLHVRVRAYDREQAWAPAYVANELAGTRQAAQRHRHDATLRAAEATAATGDSGDTDRARLRAQAEQAAALADALDARVTELEAVDAARAHWYAHTAETRAAADRARAELSARQVADDPTAIEREVTADEWLDQHRAAVEAEDPHRPITDEHDLTDVIEARESDQRTARRRAHDAKGVNGVDVAAANTDRDNTPDRRHTSQDNAGDLVADATTRRAAPAAPKLAECTRRDNAAHVAPAATEMSDDLPGRRVLDHEPGPAPRDVRQEAADEPVRADGHDPDAVRVPSPRETTDSVRRAHRALAEMKQRQAIEDRRAADEARRRDDELARWNTDDHNAHAADHLGTSTASDHDREHLTEDANNSDATHDLTPVLEVTTADDY